MIRRFFVHIVLALVLAMVLLLALDWILFAAATWNGVTILPDTVQADDLDWWESSVGDRPEEPRPGDQFLLPPGLQGVPSGWLGTDGGPGSPPAAQPAIFQEGGLTAYSLAGGSRLRGRCLVGAGDTIAYSAGVGVPLVMFERIHIANGPGTRPHPLSGDWRIELRTRPLIINLALMTLLLGGVVFALDARRLVRVVQSRCWRCGSRLPADERTCSECGEEPRRVW